MIIYSPHICSPAHWLFGKIMETVIHNCFFISYSLALLLCKSIQSSFGFTSITIPVLIVMSSSLKSGYTKATLLIVSTLAI